MLHELPFHTFGELPALGLEARVYCPCCFRWHRVNSADISLRDRRFALARFRCMNTRRSGETCGAFGVVHIQPAERLPLGGAIRLAFLWCKRCVPSWEISHLPIDRAPWNVADATANHRFRCPGCGSRIEWHIQEPAWRPSSQTTAAGLERPSVE